MAPLTGSQAVRSVFFGNYFYGLCAVALAAEAALQQHYPVPDPLFFLVLFFACVLFYTKAYLGTETSADPPNIRSDWYARNHSAIHLSQIILLILLLAATGVILHHSWNSVLAMNTREWILSALFPLVAVCYYGLNLRGRNYSIRNIGGLKPFVIGFSWAGVVTLYPVLYFHLKSGSHFFPDLSSAFLFSKNMMFISVLCIMFDIKDYEMDYNFQLKTFVVKLGARRTIWRIIVPLCVAGLAAYIGYAVLRNFSTARVLINSVPFLLTIALAASLQRNRSILYYLVVIDGLMLVKAACGIIGMRVA